MCNTIRSKEIKSDNYCYRKSGRAITIWGAIETSPILEIGQCNNTKFFSHFGYTNIIFSACTSKQNILNDAFLFVKTCAALFALRIGLSQGFRIRQILLREKGITTLRFYQY